MLRYVQWNRCDGDAGRTVNIKLGQDDIGQMIADQLIQGRSPERNMAKLAAELSISVQ
jgi:hypothetical protein